MILYGVFRNNEIVALFQQRFDATRAVPALTRDRFKDEMMVDSIFVHSYDGGRISRVWVIECEGMQTEFHADYVLAARLAIDVRKRFPNTSSFFSMDVD
jgi:hypothetical protein